MLKIHHSPKYKGIRARVVSLSATKGNLINKGFHDNVCRCGVIVFYVTE
ncbi:MAG: hypothetical protein LBL39_03595 [Planctomycetaceae bacterium]|nr:hypothetical protein [Planctomycetaceae bacterium]